MNGRNVRTELLAVGHGCLFVSDENLSAHLRNSQSRCSISNDLHLNPEK